MNAKLLVLWLVPVLAGSAFAQPNPDTLWTRTYGGSFYDEAYSVQQTMDDGFVVAGYTGSFSTGNEFYVVKTNAQGDTLWTRTYAGNGDTRANSIQQTTDGGYVVAGSTDSIGGGYIDFYVVRINEQGDALWTRTYGGAEYDEAASIQQTTDGGFVVAGSTGAGSGDFYVVKTNSQGDTLWTRTYGGAAYDHAYSIQQTTDGGYVVAGETRSFGAGNADFYVVKTNSQGDTLWTRTYGGSGNDNAYSIQQAMDGGYVIAGKTIPLGAPANDFYVVKTDSMGDTLWTRTYGGIGGDDQARSLQQTAEGGFVVAGYAGPYGIWSGAFYVVKIDGQGGTLWTRTYGGSGDDHAYSIRQTTDGGYVIAGWTDSFGAGYNDFYVVRTGPDVLAADERRILQPASFSLSAYPNPFNPSAQITYALPGVGRVSLTVSNLLGQNVAALVDEMQAAGTHTVSFDGSALPSGIYLYRLQSGEFVQTQKLVLLK